MREYELTVVYDLAVAESGGPDASVAHLTAAVESRGGAVLKVDHWGRRRLAYPIGTAIDADYIVSRVNLDPASVSPLEAALGIDERVYRHLIVRADELPLPPPPREPRVQPVAAETVAEAPAAEAPQVETPVDEAPAAEPAIPAATPEVVESAPATAAERAGEPEARPGAASAAETSD